MKRILVLTIVLALGVVGAAMAAQQGGTIEGIAKDSCQKPIPGAKVVLRNTDTGGVAAETVAGNGGTFSFASVAPGNYVVEVVDQAGKIIGVSPAIPVTAGSNTPNVRPVGSTACALAGVAAAGGLAAFFLTTGGLVMLGSAAAVTAAGVIAVTSGGTASQSR